MRWTLLTLLAAVLPGVSGAQVTPEPERQVLPAEVRREAVDRWNGASSSAIRTSGRLEIPSGRDVRGDVIVLTGPLVIGGRVTGNVVALNSDVSLEPTARLEGDLLVVGGEVTGLNTARVGGRTRIYRQSLQYREDGDRLVATDETGGDDVVWWRRVERSREGNWSDALRVVQAGPYNRVEGLPIELGPATQRLTPWGSVNINAAAIVRTGSSFGSEGSDIGQTFRAEVRVGRERAIGIGGSAFNMVDAIESWQLSDLETALAAFVTRRDYRDYYQRHGGNAFLTLYGARNLSLTGSFGEERWSSRVLRNPFTLFNSNNPWRPNPIVDEGLFHLANVSLKFDTRTDPEDPWSGWYLSSDLEYGRGTSTTLLPVGLRARSTFGDMTYTRGFFDLRRYNRLGPSAQLNMRLVLGGWIDGDPLPLQRRLSVDGPGALPGFDFRSARAGPDVGACNAGGVIAPARPALCDRIALGQIEFRRDLKLDITSLWEDWPRHYRSARGDVAWVLFMDAGRGWIVDRPHDALTFGSGVIPPLSTFRTDIGTGFDFGGIGVYGAKAISASTEPMNFFVRLRHRF